MKAESILNRRVSVGEGAYVELVVWLVPTPLLGSAHPYKYRLALVADGDCVVRFDNEAGKGDHKHLGSSEVRYVFRNLERLQSDFFEEVHRWLLRRKES
jgi:Family of unknown function (DUF6516)